MIFFTEHRGTSVSSVIIKVILNDNSKLFFVVPPRKFSNTMVSLLYHLEFTFMVPPPLNVYWKSQTRYGNSHHLTNLCVNYVLFNLCNYLFLNILPELWLFFANKINSKVLLSSITIATKNGSITHTKYSTFTKCLVCQKQDSRTTMFGTIFPEKIVQKIARLKCRSEKKLGIIQEKQVDSKSYKAGNDYFYCC